MSNKTREPGAAAGPAQPAGAPGSPGPASAEDPGAAGRYVRTQFLDRVAHDIRSPTGVAWGTLDELERGPIGDDQRALVTMARRSLRRLLRLADRLTLLSEMEAGPEAPARSRADLRELAQLALAEVQEIDGRKGVQVEIALPEEPLWVLVEPRWLKAALLEMLGNALRHAASRARLEAAREDGTVVLRVEDDGVGIPAADAEALFRRFTPRPQGRGLGISLSLAADVARLHGGALRLEQSRLPIGRRGGPGAAFVLRLPLEEAQHARRE